MNLGSETSTVIPSFFYQITDIWLNSKFFLFISIILACFVLYVLLIRIITHFSYYNQQTKQKIINIAKIFTSGLEAFKKPKLARPWLVNMSFIKSIHQDYTFIPTILPWNVFILAYTVLLFLSYIYLQSYLSSFLSLIIVLLIFGVIIILIKTQAKQQKEKLVTQLPSFLLALSNALEAGYSLNNSFYFIVNEIENPLQNEIKKITKKLKLNIPIHEALETFAHNIDHKDIYFFTESTIIQLQTGGNLIFLFKKISKLIEDRLKLKQDLQTFTSQGRYSGIIIASLWFLSLILFWFMAPQHIEVLFKTPTGQTMLGISLLLEIIGFFMIWKITNIKF